MFVLFVGLNGSNWYVTQKGVDSPFCGNITFPCNTLGFITEKSQSGDVIILGNKGTNPIVYSLCSSKPLDKNLRFKGTGSLNQARIGCSQNVPQDERANTSSENAYEFFTELRTIFEIVNGVVFENIMFNHGSLLIYNANVSFLNYSINDVTIFVIGPDMLSYYTWRYNKVGDLWHAIEEMQRKNESLGCKNTEITFENTTWKYVKNINSENKQTVVVLDGLISDGIQVICEAITLNILNSFVADKLILLNTISSSTIKVSNSSFKGDGKGNILQGGIKVFSYQAPEVIIENCKFENLKYSDPFVPILYKHSKLCKYKAGAVTIQTVSTDKPDNILRSLRIEHSQFVQSEGALTVFAIGGRDYCSKMDITITDSTFTRNSN